ncbi:MAG: sugar phosphate isomerase/epimerase family protein [Cellulosilyticaceae bacterium]
MNTYISHLLNDEEMKEVLKQYPVGIEVIHFGISSVLDEVEQEINGYQQRMGEYIQTRELSLHGPFFDLAPASFDSQIRKITLERFETTYQVAKVLGAKRVVYHTGFIPITYYIEGWLDNSITFWKEFMGNKDESIQVHLENVYEEEYWPMIKVIDEVGHPAFNICLDVGHVNAYSTKTIEEWIEGVGHRIGHVHLHNNDGDKDAHYELGQGSLDMHKAVEFINKIAPAASFTIEVSSKEKMIHSLEWIRKQEEEYHQV